jgi:predicted nicotinamide N-methyase
MVNDAQRTNAYLRAIELHVKGKIVLEVGTGAKAVLAIACARAGAAKVFAIEVNPEAADAAQQTIDSQNLSDVIFILRGRVHTYPT